MLQLFDTLGVYMPFGYYAWSSYGTANPDGFRQASIGVTFNSTGPEGLRFFETYTNGFAGTRTNVNISPGLSDPRILHPPVNDGSAYAGALRMRARQLSLTGTATRMGIFDTWLAPYELGDKTQRLWGLYSSAGQLGEIDFALDFALEGGEETPVTGTFKCTCA